MIQSDAKEGTLKAHSDRVTIDAANQINLLQKVFF